MAWLIVHNLRDAPSATGSKNFAISNRNSSFDFWKCFSLCHNVIWRDFSSWCSWCYFCWSHSGRCRILWQQKQCHTDWSVKCVQNLITDPLSCSRPVGRFFQYPTSLVYFYFLSGLGRIIPPCKLLKNNYKFQKKYATLDRCLNSHVPLTTVLSSNKGKQEN